jgi:hypothetical protein
MNSSVNSNWLIERAFTVLGDLEPNHLEELNTYSEQLTSDFCEIFP